MATARSKSQTVVYIKEDYDVRQVRRTALFGIFSWWEEVQREKIGRELIIETNEPYDRVILNGKQLTT